MFWSPYGAQSLAAQATRLWLLLAKLQAVHQDIGVVKEPHHHKDLGDLGIRVPKLLHGSGVELQSGFTVIQR